MVARAVYSGLAEGEFHGTIMVRTKDESPTTKYSEVELPYVVRVLHGSLLWELNNTAAPNNTGSPSPLRCFTLTNTFSMPVQLTGIKLEDDNFHIERFEQDAVISPGESLDAVHLSFTSNDTNLQYVTQLEVNTNATMVTVPLIVFHGHLSYSLVSGGHTSSSSNGTKQDPQSETLVVDFGNMAVGEIRTAVLNLSNPNPVSISLNAYTSSIHGAAGSLQYHNQPSNTSHTRAQHLHPATQHRLSTPSRRRVKGKD